MDKTYGEQWSDKLETIQELTADWSETKMAKLKFSDVEEQYIISLKRAGEFDAFAAKIYKEKLEKLKEKSTPLSRGGRTKKSFKGKPRDMFDAAKRAELKASRGT